MHRRTYLTRCGLALGLATGASGCTTETLQESERDPPPAEPIAVEDVDLPVRQPLEVAAAAIERAGETDVRSPADLEGFLADQGLEVDRLDVDDEAGERILSLEYAAAVSDEQGLMDHLGAVAGGYAALADEDHESERVDATVLESDQPYGEYEVRRHWADDFNAGDLSAREYAAEIAVTVASV